MIIKQDHKNYDCYLVDYGTLDTVIKVNGKEYIYSQEYACNFRDDNGMMTDDSFIELCRESIEAYEITGSVELLKGE